MMVMSLSQNLILANEKSLFFFYPVICFSPAYKNVSGTSCNGYECRSFEWNKK